MMSIWNLVFDLALPKLLVSYLTKSFSPVKFDSRLHGGSFFSHSIKSPITTLQVCLSELEQIANENKKLGSDPILQKYLSSAYLATKQISSLVDGATSEDPYQIVHSINVKEFFNQLQTLFVHRHQSSRLILSVNLISGKETIKMNKYFFFELMQCLINNAFESYKKNDKQKLVIVTVVCKNKKLEIQVQDFGEGATYLTTRLMLNKGFTTKDKGHGFGLWFVKDVLETGAKSKLKVLSEKGYGTTIRFSLPLS